MWRRRARPQAAPVPLTLPRLDGSTWPPAAQRRSFESSTYHEMGLRRAHEPDAHALAERLVAATLPRLRTGVGAEDAPYLHKVFVTAARVGAGIGLMESETASPASALMAPDIAGALGLARAALPPMREDWACAATWFLLAGHYLARHDREADEVLRELGRQVEPGAG